MMDLLVAKKGLADIRLKIGLSLRHNYYLIVHKNIFIYYIFNILDIGEEIIILREEITRIIRN